MMNLAAKARLYAPLCQNTAGKFKPVPGEIKRILFIGKSFYVYGVPFEKTGELSLEALKPLKKFINKYLKEVPPTVRKGLVQHLKNVALDAKKNGEIVAKLRNYCRLLRLVPTKTPFLRSVRKAYGSLYPLHSRGHLTAWEKKHARSVAEMLATFDGDTDTLKPLYDTVCSYVNRQGIRPVEVSEKMFSVETALPALLRMANRDWWKRKGQRERRVYLETMQIVAGNVHKRKNPYLSKDALTEIHAQEDDNDQYSRMMEVVSDDGEAVALSEVIKGSVANPEIRRMEMMVRAKGQERLADDLGYTADLVTITCPSKYHRWASSPDGKGETVNPKWVDAGGMQPRDAQAYLSNLWKRVRAKLKREELPYFGLRVAEAHHEGCPHWHILVFSHPEQRREILKIIRDYATASEQQELIDDHKKRRQKIISRKKRGQLTSYLEKIKRWYQPRFDVVAIDPEKGSAVAYIAKYISKNINGGRMTGADDNDHEAETDAATGANAVTAWSRWHCIRQFQFFGAASVTLWRELRRVREPLTNSIEPLRAAADSGNWSMFQKKAQELAAELEVDETDFNQYGEKQRRIIGVSVGSDLVVTRATRWSLRKRGEARAPRIHVNNCTGFISKVFQTTRERLKENLAAGLGLAFDPLRQLFEFKQQLELKKCQNSSQAPPV